jgi:type IX secretion system PorP/SprF family membrane protein
MKQTENRIMRVCILLIISFVFAEIRVNAQSDADLTQRWFNESLYNPAAVGNSFTTGVFLHARQQWVGMNGAPSTQAGTFDMYAEPINSGFGLTLTADKIGPTRSYNARLAYAYYLHLNKKASVSFGLSAGVLSRNRQVSGSSIDDPNDPAWLQGNASEMSPDFDFGAEYKGMFKLGVAVRHIGVQPSTHNLPKYSTNIWAYASSRFNIASSTSIEPLVSFTYRDNVYRYEAGFLFYFFKTQGRDTYNDRFWLGAVYRTDNNFAVMAGMNITPKIRLGYSFDYGAGDVMNISKYGTHELFLAFQFNRIFYKDEVCSSYRNVGIVRRR